MFMALKGTGRYPADKAIVASLWDRETGYWYIVEDEPNLSLREPAVRAARISSLLPEKLAPRFGPLYEFTGKDVRDQNLTRVCTVPEDPQGWFGVFARFDDGSAPTAEAMCARLVELLNGAEE